MKNIEHRLEVLDGYLIAFLNLDEVIRIIRFEDEPKAKLMAAFKLSDVQAEAILNLRLKSLSRLEEMELKGEHDKLSKERKDLKGLLGIRRFAVGAHLGRGARDARQVRQEDRSREETFEFCRCARNRCRSRTRP